MVTGSSYLLEFAQRIGKTFLYFQDQPHNHWWPGDGIGTVFSPGTKTLFQTAQGQAGRSVSQT